MTLFWRAVAALDPDLVPVLRTEYRYGGMAAVWTLAVQVLDAEDVAALRIARSAANRAAADQQRDRMDARIQERRAAAGR